MANEQTLTGLELRKAVLEAAGWTTFEWEAGLYGLRKPDGKPLLAYQDFTIKMAHSWVSEADAWQHAPAVESSVDAALRWLTLPDGLRWEITGPCSHFGYDVFIQDSAGFPITSASSKIAADGMCQAYLAWKAGA